MLYPDRQKNRDIVKRIRRCLIVKGCMAAAAALLITLLFALGGYSVCSERIGTGNAAALWVFCAVLPFLLSGFLRDLFDRSWEGEVLSAKKRIIRRHGDWIERPDEEPYRDLTVLTILMPNEDIKTLYVSSDEIYLFYKGCRIRHIRGTKHYQMLREGRGKTDCVICGHVNDEVRSHCEKCGFSLVK